MKTEEKIETFTRVLTTGKIKRKTVSGIILTMLLTCMLTLEFNVQPVKAEPTTWTVDDDGPADFSTIQEAINAASNGDTIFVRNGTYIEHVVVDKTISLIGENRVNTIIDGNESGNVVVLNANNVNICNFTVENSGWANTGIHAGVSNSISQNIIRNNGDGIHLALDSTVTNNAITNNQHSGINLSNAYNNTISGNNIANNRNGVWLDGSNNTISENDITNNGWGIVLYYGSYNNTISGNKITDNTLGIWIYYPPPPSSNYSPCDNNIISGNDITNNGEGVLLDGSLNSTISGNNITNNAYGIRLYWSSNNAISGNNITNNDYGIWLEDSSNNRFFHNNFVDNTQQVYIENSDANFWDDGYPSGGNYWSDHVCTGNPSNGSQPYVIDANNIDHYPFQDPNGWLLPDTTPPTIAVLSPQNTTYTTTSVPLTFTVNEPTSWIGYSLDSQNNVTVSGNTTIVGLSDGPHSLIIYAKDNAGNIGESEIIYFTEEVAGFPIWIIAAIVIAVAFAAVLVLRRRT